MTDMDRITKAMAVVYVQLAHEITTLRRENEELKKILNERRIGHDSQTS